MAIALVIGEQQRAEIAHLMQFAERRKVPLSKMKLIADGKLDPIGDDPDFRLFLPMGFRVVFSIEEHPGGTMKHLSISVRKKGRWPSPEAVDMIAKEFGIKDFKQEHCYQEPVVEAVNIVARHEYETP